MIRTALIFIFILSLFAYRTKAQVTDTLQGYQANPGIATDTTALTKSEKKKVYSRPRRATVLSAVLPGLGQAYNKKYWKIPLIYAGLGGLGYMFIVNNKQYNYYRKNLIAANDDDSSTLNETRYSSGDLQTLKIQYRKYRDFAAIGIGLIYLFNIIDANVDAHLKTFDVSDDLSLHIDPWQGIIKSSNGYKTATGLSVKINFN